MIRGLSLLLLVACGTPAEPDVEPEPGVWTADELATLASLRLDVTPRPDPTNRVADAPDAARLGQALFFDASLSPSGTVSCATCHEPGLAFTDGKPLSEGVGQTARNAPTVIGSQYGPWLFWDGRADSLWSQASGPVESAVEMGSDRTFVARRVLEAHGEAYETVFGAAPELADLPDHARPDADAAHPHAVAWAALDEGERERVMRVYTNALKAIAAYERTLTPTDAPFDHYVDALLAGDATGGDHLDASAIRGLSLFLRRGQCTACHNGPMFTDRAFHNLGLPFEGPYDAGRSVGAAQVLEGELNCRSAWSDAEDCPELTYLDPTFPDFQQAFKTPTLRNVALTAPYMHHGQVSDLRAVLAFYSELPGDAASNHRELTLQPLALTEQEKDDVIAFLLSLTGAPLPAERLRPPGP